MQSDLIFHMTTSLEPLVTNLVENVRMLIFVYGNLYDVYFTLYFRVLFSSMSLYAVSFVQSY